MILAVVVPTLMLGFLIFGLFLRTA